MVDRDAKQVDNRFLPGSLGLRQRGTFDDDDVAKIC